MKKALLVGIDDYPNTRLRCCVNDAKTLADILEFNGDSTRNFDVQLIIDVWRKAELKRKILELFEGDNDTALLYFAGHGCINETGGCIVTPDYEKYDEGIPMDYILTLAFDSKARNKIIILDCCNSGAFGSLPRNKEASELKEGITILTASLHSEPALEVNGHGIFSNLLIEALKGGAADLRGHITPGSVYAYIDQALGAYDQRPVFKTHVSRFTSLRNVTPLLLN